MPSNFWRKQTTCKSRPLVTPCERSITIYIHLLPNRIHRRSREIVSNLPNSRRIDNHDGRSYTHSRRPQLELSSYSRPILIIALLQCWFKANVMIKCCSCINNFHMNVTTNANAPHPTNRPVNQSEQSVNQSTNRWKINHATHRSNDQTIVNNQPPQSLIKHTINRTTNQSTNRSNNPLFNNHSFYKSINPPIKWSTKQSINISSDQPVTWSSIEHWIGKAIKQPIHQSISDASNHNHNTRYKAIHFRR